MAIRSAAAYVINEEQDGFVAVDFDFINGCDEQDRLDLTAWEFVDQVDADVDVCSEESEDDVSDSVGSGGYDAETVIGEDVESLPDLSMLPEYSDGESNDDVSESVEFAGSLVSDVKSVPETIFSPEYSDGDDVGEDAKSVTEAIMSPEYLEEKIDDKSVPENVILPEYTTERVAGFADSVAAYRSRDEKYSYEEEEDVEEDDYDLDDELVPYYVNNKLGRERMRKLGKRSCTKSVKSKRLTYNYNKAGCFRGKHGLGLKHSLM